MFACLLCLLCNSAICFQSAGEIQEEISTRIYQKLLSSKAQINISENSSPPSKCLFKGSFCDVARTNDGREGYDIEQVQNGSSELSRIRHLRTSGDSLHNAFIMTQDGKQRRF